MSNELSLSSIKDEKNYINIKESFLFFFRHPRLILWSIFILAITFTVTFLTSSLFIDLIEKKFTFPLEAPALKAWYDYILYTGWWIINGLYVIISRIVSFYIAFMIAFTCSSPFYSFLSSSSEDRFRGQKPTDETSLTIPNIIRDVIEAAKISVFSIFLSICALLLNFIPIVGQIISFAIYLFINTLVFIDFPAGRRTWTLKQKGTWIISHKVLSFRLGLIPTLVSMIPLVNIFFMTLLYPLYVVHGTLNFTLKMAQTKQ